MAKKSKKKNKKKVTKQTKRSRTQRPYPTVAFSEATRIGASISEFAGDKIRRLTLFEKLDLSPTSSSSKMLIVNSNKYGITTGSYIAEWLELTDDGRAACDPLGSARDKLSARFRLAIEKIEPFNALYEEYVGKRVVVHEVMYDYLNSKKELKVADTAECVDIFIVNIKDLGLLRTIAGAETLVPINQALDELGTEPPDVGDKRRRVVGQPTTKWDTICFYVTPIGAEGSDSRKHSDLFKSQLVDPAMKELGLEVVRADEVDTPGMITTSILEHIKLSRLVIADLSTLNPNVFYEIALRHACRLPIVQLIRKNDDLPFDIGQVKTIIIDDTDIYSFVPQIETFRSEIAATARRAIEHPEEVSNPVTVFYPEFWN